MADAASKTQGNAPAQTGALHAATAKPLPDLTGRTLGDYQILRRLGVGGMGQVYLARQLSLKREVALKLLRDELNKNPTALMRFQAEAEAVAKLNHPNIVHIHQMGEADGLRYMALEYVEGRNLRDHLARKGPPDLPVSLSIIRQVVSALHQAHEHGIVHRDIKPENILVTRKVEVKVTDFGLSRFFSGQTPALNLTQSGVTLGTPLYMSPEQVQGHAVDHRSDIYSLGVTCYHLLSGEPPFRGATAFDVALKHVQDQPQPLHDLCPDLPAGLCSMVHKMMAKIPADRYQSAREVLKDLSRVRDSLTGGGGAQGHLHASGFAITGVLATGAATQANGSQHTEATAKSLAMRKRLRWAVAGGVCLLAATGGAIFAAARTPAESERQVDGAAPPSPSVPAIRLPDRFATTRERELLAVISGERTLPDGRRETINPDLVLKASIELGLMYVQERRLVDAAERFKFLANEKKDEKPLRGGRFGPLAGRLGQAVVLAYHDQGDAALASNALVINVVNDPFPNAKPEKKADKHFQQISKFLKDHPDLAQAVSDALNRNLITLGISTGRYDQPALELLRAPPRVGAK